MSASRAVRSARRSSLPQPVLPSSTIRVEKDSLRDSEDSPSPDEEGGGRRLSTVFGSEFANLPSLYHEDTPGRRKRAVSATRVRELPPPLPLHDFSKDRPQTQLPKTGFRYILPAPRHYYAACAKNEPLESVHHETVVALAAGLKEKQAERRRQQPGRVVFSADHRLDHGEASQSAQQAGDEDTLEFESRFESGNLLQATQVGPYEYDLELRYDINTGGHAQWFYFSVKNTRKERDYVLNLINFCKKDSLYGRGLRPLMFSEKRAKTQMQGWKRCGKDICYFENATWPSLEGEGSFTLHFCTQFQYDNDTVYFAHCYPYSYRDLQEYLEHLEVDPARRKHLRRRALCETIAKNSLDLITVTAPPNTPEETRSRPIVCISARVHPGETNASWMMKGVLDFLTSEEPVARALREGVEFRLVPMLNPDGVINGNYRCNLSGHDLNRRWKNPHRELHPTIFHYKQMLSQLSQERTVLMTIDLHGHSRAKNVFIYGCHSKFWKDCAGPAPTPLHEQVFPWILGRRSDPFSFRQCKFKVQRCKESSGRVVCWRQMRIFNSYTLEATFAGADQGAGKGKHLSTYDLEAVGRAMCESIADYLRAFKDASVLEGMLAEIAAHRDHGADTAGMDDEVDSSSDDDVIQAPPRTSKGGKRKGRLRLKARKHRNALSDEDADEGPSPFGARAKMTLRRNSSEDSAGGAGDKDGLRVAASSGSDGGEKRRPEMTQQTIARLSQPRRLTSSRKLSNASAEWRLVASEEDTGGGSSPVLAALGEESRTAWLARVYASMSARDSEDEAVDEEAKAGRPRSGGLRKVGGGTVMRGGVRLLSASRRCGSPQAFSAHMPSI